MLTNAEDGRVNSTIALPFKRTTQSGGDHEALRAQADDLSSRLEVLQVISPPVHHPDPFIPIIAARVCPSHIVALNMRKLALDDVGMPEA